MPRNNELSILDPSTSTQAKGLREVPPPAPPAKVFIKLPGSTRVFTPGAVDAVQGSSSETTILLQDGVSVGVVRWTPDQVVAMLKEHGLTFIHFRKGLGYPIFVNAETLNGYSTNPGTPGIRLHVRGSFFVYLHSFSVVEVESALGDFYGSITFRDPGKSAPNQSNSSAFDLEDEMLNRFPHHR